MAGLARLAQAAASEGSKISEPPAHPSPKSQYQGYLMCIPEIARETTSCWISAVPSKMS
jgi:hypothetical protein